MKRLLLASTLLLLALPASASADTISLIGPPLGISEGARAAPYPSTIAVANVDGAITKVTAGPRGTKTNTPEDLDMLLVGPGGQNVILFSDACRNEFWGEVDLELDDAAPGFAPQTQPCDADFFKPTNYPPAENFPAPAPNPPYGSALSVFNGTSPVGAWNLFIVDDDPTFGGAGSIEGWSLTLSGVSSTLKCGGKRATIVGTAERNVIRGTKRADVIVALGGKDKVVGRGGNDRICGGPGKDKLFGGPGRDRLYGGGGKDRLLGGKGKDLCKGGKGRDKGKACEKGKL